MSQPAHPIFPALILAALTAPAWSAPSGGGSAGEREQIVTVFDHAPIEWDRDAPDLSARDGLIVRDKGQAIETTIQLPDAPANQRDARRIVATVQIEPVLIEHEGKKRPGDPWTRLGTISLVQRDPKSHEPIEVELMRFITGFGGAGEFEQDLTPLAPLLAGRGTIRASISTWMTPAWRATVKLTYAPEGAGYRRPAFAQLLFQSPNVEAQSPTLKATIVIPRGLERPRLRVISTGHATDGTAGNEFLPCTHVLRIDGREVARWRPWSESGGPLRQLNPTSGRQTIDGRELWSSDLDRSGWHPGRVVEPLMIPLAELTPGVHEIELTIEGIRPKDDSGRGYWRVSAIAVADEPWLAEQTPPAK